MATKFLIYDETTHYQYGSDELEWHLNNGVKEYVLPLVRDPSWWKKGEAAFKRAKARKARKRRAKRG
jgi:hypothetical protein